MDDREETPTAPLSGPGFFCTEAHTLQGPFHLADSMRLFLLNCAFLLLNASVHRFPELMIIFNYFKQAKPSFGDKPRSVRMI